MQKSEALTKKVTRSRLIVYRFKKNKAGVAGSLILLIIVLSAIFAPFLAPYDPLAIDTTNRYTPPSSAHLLGTDELGRDMLSRLLYGGRMTLIIGIMAVVASAIIGIPIGAVSAYYGGTLDTLITRFIDILNSLPTMLLAIATVAILGVGATNAIIAIGITRVPFYARVVRGSIMSVKKEDYVQSAKAIGASDFRIIFIDILPNVVGPLIVQTTLLLSSAILITSGLGFLGMGVGPPTPEWGAMLSSGRAYLLVAPHVVIMPSLAIFLVVLSLNLMGDGLRDALDPKMPTNVPRGL